MIYIFLNYKKYQSLRIIVKGILNYITLEFTNTHHHLIAMKECGIRSKLLYGIIFKKWGFEQIMIIAGKCVDVMSTIN